ncbi:MAG: TetR/AcrR family transcriptional regulator [Lachnospiraceae bacterium]|nr:TetR/AcrR family transcriptional regulator [Lachnospiraceae bacterium]
MAKAEYRSAIRSRKLINSALADLLQEKPLDKITVTDVVKKAEINRGTFYAHYADIPDVINHLIQQTFSDITAVISTPPQNIVEMPIVLLKQVQTILESDLDFYKKVMASSASTFMQEQLVSIVLDYLLQHEKEYNVKDHNQFVLNIHFCAGGLIYLYREWFAGNSALSLNELTAHGASMIQKVLDSEFTAK